MSIERKAFEAYNKNRSQAEKYWIPDRCWCDWYVRGYRQGEQELKDKAIEAYKRNCRNYTACCLDQKPCTADCEYLGDFIQKLNKE